MLNFLKAELYVEKLEANCGRSASLECQLGKNDKKLKFLENVPSLMSQNEKNLDFLKSFIILSK